MNFYNKMHASKLNTAVLKIFQRHYSVQLKDLNLITKTPWDVVISGGGMVGCALAASIGSSSILSNKKILLLETSLKTDYKVDPNVYLNRVCALNPNTKLLFEGLKAWDKIRSTRLKEVRKMVVWEACSDARISFQRDQMLEDIAYIVENDVILGALNSTISELPDNVHVLRGCSADDYNLPNNEGSSVEIILKDGAKLKSKLLIGADGVNSLVRKKMNVRYIGWSYNQRGIVATLRLSEPTENIVAWQRFLPTGPIALLPLTNELCSLVWTVSLPMCEKLLNMSEENFIDALNSALWSDKSKNAVVESAMQGIKNLTSSAFPAYDNVRQLPPSILSVEPNSRTAFPLALGHSTHYVAPRVALIGDSAHRVHPLAGQGVNLGFGDVKCLTDCLEKSVYNGQCIGSLEGLLDYETERQRHVLPTMFSIDVLNRIYGSESTPIVMARSLGVAALDMMGFLKGKMIQHAST